MKQPIEERQDVMILHLADGLGDPDAIAERTLRKMSKRPPIGYCFGFVAWPVFRILPIDDPLYDEAIEAVRASMARGGHPSEVEDRAKARLVYEKPFEIEGSPVLARGSTIRVIRALPN